MAKITLLPNIFSIIKSKNHYEVLNNGQKK